jgi:hypothetical protein
MLSTATTPLIARSHSAANADGGIDLHQRRHSHTILGDADPRHDRVRQGRRTPAFISNISKPQRMVSADRTNTI